MSREEIAELLEAKCQELLDLLNSQPDTSWTDGPAGKWTTGQHVLHLIQSLKPLNRALSMPKFILRYKFGKTNRELRDYETVVRRYHERLDLNRGITFGPSRDMKIPPLADKNYLIDQLQIENKKVQFMTRRWKEKDLDTLILPHPLMGKMPVREMLMWSAYHVEHHCGTLQKYYS
ncbi:MAG: DinB family protein [Flavobacteriaceae bacterium]|nr:DinB family protein [Flavobacteriaceae bacterium]